MDEVLITVKLKIQLASKGSDGKDVVIVFQFPGVAVEGHMVDVAFSLLQVLVDLAVELQIVMDVVDQIASHAVDCLGLSL